MITAFTHSMLMISYLYNAMIHHTHSRTVLCGTTPKHLTKTDTFEFFFAYH